MVYGKWAKYAHLKLLSYFFLPFFFLLFQNQIGPLRQRVNVPDDMQPTEGSAQTPESSLLSVPFSATIEGGRVNMSVSVSVSALSAVMWIVAALVVCFVLRRVAEAVGVVQCLPQRRSKREDKV